MNIDFTLLTDKYVSSHLKCRSSLLSNGYSHEEDIYSDFQISEDEPPLCFWYGNSILDKDLVKVKGHL